MNPCLSADVSLSYLSTCLERPLLPTFRCVCLCELETKERRKQRSSKPLLRVSHSNVQSSDSKNNFCVRYAPCIQTPTGFVLADAKLMCHWKHTFSCKTHRAMNLTVLGEVNVLIFCHTKSSFQFILLRSSVVIIRNLTKRKSIRDGIRKLLENYQSQSLPFETCGQIVYIIKEYICI